MILTIALAAFGSAAAITEPKDVVADELGAHWKRCSASKNPLIDLSLEISNTLLREAGATCLEDSECCSGNCIYPGAAGASTHCQ